jgi:hypothetical protein
VAEHPRVLIVGGYGVFGRLLACELLATTNASLIIAGRHGDQAAACCQELDQSGRTTPLAIDLHDTAGFADRVRGCFAVACTAGPFQTLNFDLPRLAAAEGAHWVDIGDPPRWVLSVLEDRLLDEVARARGVSIVPGASTTPAFSGVLARLAQKQVPSVSRIRVTMFLGNRNSKSATAISTALASGFGSPEVVDGPEGRRRAYRIETADGVLVQRQLGVAAEFRVSFELRTLNSLVSLTQPLSRRLSAAARSTLARVLAIPASLVSRLGSDVSTLLVEAFEGDQCRWRQEISDHGQRLGILPCAIVLKALLDGNIRSNGCSSPAAVVPLDTWIGALRRRGIDL